MIGSDTGTPVTAAAAAPAASTAAQAAGQTLLNEIEAAGKEGLTALKPLLGVIARKFAAAIEANFPTGILGDVGRHVIDGLISAMFGPAPIA